MPASRTLAFALLLLATACAGTRGASKGQKQVLEITERIDEVGDALDRARAAIQLTVQAHTALVGGKDGKLVVHYAELREGLEEMTAAREVVDEALAELVEEGETYFADWKEGLDAIASETLRDQSRRRHGEARTRFDAMVVASRRIAGLWDPVQRIVSDHVAYLSHDLNVSAVQSLGEEAQQLRRAVADLGSAMETYERRAAEFRALVSPVASEG